MATYTENYSLVKPGYGDQADIDVLNRLMTDKVDALLFENRRISADEYDQTETYAVGDYAIYENVLYKCLDDTTGNFDPSKWEMTNLAKELATKGGADVTKTASGNPIEISDGASAPLVKCETQITGSQDLHGYDKPWVGGAGKNKYGNGDQTFTQAKQNIELLTPLSAGTYTFGALVESSDTDNIDCLVQLIDSNRVTLASGRISRGVTTRTYIVLSWSGNDAVKLNLYAAASYVNGAGDTASFTDIQIEQGSTATSYEPYSNICPITAYTEGSVVVSKNILTINAQSKTENGLTFTVDKNKIIINGTATEQTTLNVGTSTTVADKEYWFTGFPEGASSTTYFCTQHRTSNNRYADGQYTFTENSEPRIYVRSGVTCNNVVFDLRISEVEPTTHTTTYPSAIYRGSEDCVKGEVRGEKIALKITDASTATIKYYSELTGRVRVEYYPLRGVVKAATSYLCDCFKGKIADDGPYQVSNSTTASRCYFTFPAGTSAEDCISALATLQPTIVYEPDTPTTSSVTPTNLPIKSLSGYNHIESSTGDMEVEYITGEYQPLVDLIQSGNGHTYSTQEQVVGTWIDGKDVYEKTIYYATLSCSRSDWAQLEALDAETFISYSATAHMETSSGRQIDNNYIRISYYNGYLYHHEPEFATGMVDLYITVRYTKPTTPTRSLNLTKSAVTDEIPDEIKNAEYEEKPDVNEADDDAPTEVER